jgi:hypothetical protein
MMMRCRNARAYYAWVDPTEAKLETDPETLYQKYRQRENRTRQAICLNENGVDRLASVRDQMCRHYVAVLARNHRSRQLPRKHFLELAEQRYTVTQVGTRLDEAESEIISRTRQTERRRLKEEEIQRLLTSPVVSPEAYRKHATQHTLTPVIEAGHQRGLIESLYAETISYETIKLYDHGKGRERLELFESLFQPAEIAQTRDRGEVNRVYAVDYRNATMRRHLVNQVLDPFRDEKGGLASDVVVSASDLESHIEQLLQQPDNDIRLFFDYRADYSKKPINVLRFLLRQVGLELKRVQRPDKVQRYRLSPRKLETMQRYLHQRQSQCSQNP